MLIYGNHGQYLPWYASKDEEEVEVDPDSQVSQLQCTKPLLGVGTNVFNSRVGPSKRYSQPL